ncbi:MAG: hypothetical protein EPN26_15070, partial [Rhodospirillales bacterium]
MANETFMAALMDMDNLGGLNGAKRPDGTIDRVVKDFIGGKTIDTKQAGAVTFDPDAPVESIIHLYAAMTDAWKRPVAGPDGGSQGEYVRRFQSVLQSAAAEGLSGLPGEAWAIGVDAVDGKSSTAWSYDPATKEITLSYRRAGQDIELFKWNEANKRLTSLDDGNRYLDDDGPYTLQPNQLASTDPLQAFVGQEIRLYDNGTQITFYESSAGGAPYSVTRRPNGEEETRFWNNTGEIAGPNGALT